MLAVTDLKGRVVNNLVAESKTAGGYRVHWAGTDNSGSSVASGAYFVLLRVTQHNKTLTNTQKMILLK